MGAVHKETPGQNIGYHEYECVTLSDPRCVSHLIKWRSRIYPRNRAMDHFSDIMVCIYVDLDRLIQETKLTDNQYLTVKYLMDGYTMNDLCEVWGEERQTIEDRLKKACNKLARRNAKMNWAVVEKNYHNKVIGGKS